jgi:hypothetical protein
MQKLFKLFFIAASVLAGMTPAYAQIAGSQGDDVQFIVTPEVPGPNEQVTIQARGIGGFLGDANITWQQDSKTVLSGAGESSFSFTTKGVGVPTRVHVAIDSPTQGSFTQDFTFSPGVIHLLWEANTSVPPLYRGKALYSPGSQIKVFALPQIVANGSFVLAGSLSFQWSVGGNPVTAQSGLGRSILTYSGNQLNQGENIAVDVMLGSSKVGHAELVIPAANPQLLMYVKDPLRGTLFDQALPSNISLSGQEITLFAQPYYFANESLANKSLAYAWTLDSQATDGPDAQNGLLTLRQSGSGAGQSNLRVELQNNSTYQFLQAAAAKVTILFGQQTGTAAGFGI